MVDPTFIKNRMMHLYDSMTSAGMQPPNDQDIQRGITMLMQGNLPTGQPFPMRQSVGMGMAPVGLGQQLPTPGFQGNAVFPNQAGAGVLNGNQIPPPFGSMPITAQGNPMAQQMNPVFGQRQMMAQPQTQGFGFDTHLHLGPDGQINQINLKRALQKRIQQQRGWMA